MQTAGESVWNRARRFDLKSWITLALILMMYIVVILSVIDLGWNMYNYIIAPPLFMLKPGELETLLGLFLLVLVGIELLDTVRAYLDENVVHAEVVLEAALIAVARKIIVLDSKETSSATIFAIASLVLVLSAAYFVIKQTHASGGHGLLAGLKPQSKQPPVND